jgi:tripartite-type tricarboxylate transporter receptor subunit TctC
MNVEVNRALTSPELRPRLNAAGFVPDPRPRDAFAAYLREEVGKWAEVVRLSGARAE